MSPSTAAVGVLMPVKAFRAAKHRLSPVLDGAERAALARRLADRVIAAAHDLPVAVVCDDDEVAQWASDRACTVLWRPGDGLNRAVSDGVAALGEFDRIIVAHADLAKVEDLRPLAAFAGVTLAPDRHRDGTNVLCLPAATAFEFAYGAGSFARHRAEAHRLRLSVRVVIAEQYACDIDTPADLDYSAMGATAAVGTAQ